MEHGNIPLHVQILRSFGWLGETGVGKTSAEGRLLRFRFEFNANAIHFLKWVDIKI
jgi:hypothetical protein